MDEEIKKIKDAVKGIQKDNPYFQPEKTDKEKKKDWESVLKGSKYSLVKHGRFWKVLGVLFFIFLLVVAGGLGWFVYNGNFDSIINVTNICEGNTLSCEEVTCSPELNCVIPADLCPDTYCNCFCEDD